MRRGMRRRALAAVAIVALLPWGASGRARAQGTDAGVFYHDQSGTALQGAVAGQAATLASRRLGFAVGVPRWAPAATRLRSLWVMDRHTPRFVVLYDGGDDGYITCQLHESLSATGVVLRGASPKTISIGHTRGILLQEEIGGANPVSELIWRPHGVRYDLLGSADTSLATLLRTANSIS